MSKNKNRRYNYTDYNKVQNTATSGEFKMETVEPAEETVEPVEETIEEAVEETVEPVEETVEEAVEETVEPVEETVEPVAEAVEEPIVEDAEEVEEEIIPKTGVVLKYSNIRQNPDPDSAIIGKLKVGQKAEVYGTFNGYFKIIAEPVLGVTVIGYIRSDLIDVK